MTFAECCYEQLSNSKNLRKIHSSFNLTVSAFFNGICIDRDVYVHWWLTAVVARLCGHVLFIVSSYCFWLTITPKWCQIHNEKVHQVVGQYETLHCPLESRWRQYYVLFIDAKRFCSSTHLLQRTTRTQWHKHWHWQKHHDFRMS